MRRLLPNSPLFVLGYLLLLIAIAIGLWNGWIDLKGRPIERIQELQAPVEERDRQIEDLANP